MSERLTTAINDVLHRYSVSLDLFGVWCRDVPWKASGPFYVTTYSRRASDGRFQKAQVRIRQHLFLQQFAAIDIASTLRHADYLDRTERSRRPIWRARR